MLGSRSIQFFSGCHCKTPNDHTHLRSETTMCRKLFQLVYGHSSQCLVLPGLECSVVNTICRQCWVNVGPELNGPPKRDEAIQG